ncbi:hypothetical protein AMTRI_Chr06g177750 [Amborella trichopoda]
MSNGHLQEEEGEERSSPAPEEETPPPQIKTDDMIEKEDLQVDIVAESYGEFLPLEVDDPTPAIFYGDFPSLDEFPCFSASSSHSSNSSCSSSSSSSATPWLQQNEEKPATAKASGESSSAFLDPVPEDKMEILAELEDMELLDTPDLWDPPSSPFFSEPTTYNGGSGDFSGGSQVSPTNDEDSPSDELAKVFFEWLKSNKESISPEELRSIKLRRSTIESAARRLGGGREGMMQLLKLILAWVQNHHLQRRRNAESLSLQNQPHPLSLSNPPRCNPSLTNPHLSNPSLPNPSPSTPPLSNAWVASAPNYVDPCMNAYPLPSQLGCPDLGFSHGGPDNMLLGDGVYGGNRFSGCQVNFQGERGHFPVDPGHFPVDHSNFPAMWAAHHSILGLNPGGSFLGFSNPAMVHGDCTMASATKEARKKRMARQRRFLSHHHHSHGHHGRHNGEHGRGMQVNEEGLVSNGGEKRGVWSSSSVMEGGVSDHVLVHGQGFNRHVASERRQGWKPEKNLKFLLQKVLKQSDVGNLGRIVLPKKEAETHLPELEARDGITIAMEDIGTSRVWNMRYRFWPNNKSRMYLLENTGDFVRSNGLQEGDFIVIYSDTKCGKYMIRGVKVPRQESKAETKMPMIKVQKTLHASSIKPPPPSSSTHGDDASSLLEAVTLSLPSSSCA